MEREQLDRRPALPLHHREEVASPKAWEDEVEQDELRGVTFGRPGPRPDAMLDRSHGLHAVEVYGAGGCPTCRDAELRGALRVVRELLAPSIA